MQSETMESVPHQTGGRNTVLTAQNAANAQATDSAVIALNGGKLVWTYNTKFKYPPNVTATAELARAVDVPVIASGGVASLDDVKRLARAELAGCIIGRALYEGRLDLKEAIAWTKKEDSHRH